jgi:nucleoid DNA-binding protein
MTWAEIVAGAASVGILPAHPARGKQRVVPKTAAEVMLRAAFMKIAERVMHGEKVTIPDFGTFYPLHRKARTIRDLRSKQMMALPASHSIGFHTSKAIKR